MKKYLLLVALTGLSACHSGYHLANRTANRIGVDSLTATADTSVANFLQPYRQGLDRTMNEVLTHTTGRIEKGQPNGPLNDLLTDALLQQASQRYGKPVDFSHLNFGGIRNNLPEGNITTGSIFEVMPFDNQLVVLTLTGEMVQQLLNHFAAGNKLVVGGLRTKIHDGKVQSVTFTNGRTLQPNETYTVAMSDYIADGGDNANFLKNAIRRENINYLIRDALIDYFRQQGKSGQPITPVTDGRISIE
ncbi:5'-nucleotidase C-terminal domain-containing protein [Spirosoma spitsbergense]|uniref:5'-nucleotidase C-terminal domain-containing protein n=1 Tax=Spirosoma spitsbergense TaxID=431554 RepID=UPI0003812EA6|nr:5'-nucleotidase [Spirosoma spitsbergense]